jgi:hypothetical protein
MSADESDSNEARHLELRDLVNGVTKLQGEIEDFARRWKRGELRGDESSVLDFLAKQAKGLDDIRVVQRRILRDFRDAWDVHVKMVNYLLIAHAAGLVTCVTLLKDYQATPLKGIGFFVVLFACGLILAIVATFLLLRQRLSFGIAALSIDDMPLEKLYRQGKWVRVVGGFSCLFLLAAIVVVACRFYSL